MQEMSRRNQHFTDSVIRRMTRVSLACGAINLAQGFPDFDPPQVLLDALKERHEPPIKDTLVRCKDCKHWSNHKPGEFVCRDCTLLGVPTYWRDYCSCGEEMSR